MRVAAEGMSDQGLPGGETDPTVRLEEISLPGDDDLGLAAAVEIFDDAVVQFRFDALA